MTRLRRYVSVLYCNISVRMLVVRQFAFGAILLSLTAAAAGCTSKHPNPEHVVSLVAPVAFNPQLSQHGLNMVAVPLVADQQRIIGQVWVWVERGRLYTRYMTEGDWQLSRTRVALGETLSEIPTQVPGCPTLDKFRWAAPLPPSIDQHDAVIDLAAVGLEDAEVIVIAAYAEAYSQTHGHADAWADGLRFPGCRASATHVSVDLRQLRGLMLWNKLGSIHEVTHSEIGPDGLVIGDISLFPARHGDGFRPSHRMLNHNIPDSYVAFPGLQLGPQGSIEFWYQPDWEDATIDHEVDILYYGVPEDGHNTHIAMAFNDWQNRLNTGVFDRSTTESVFVQEFAPIPGWSTTEPIHLALTWNDEALAATDRLQVFVNGAALPQTTYYGDPRLHNWMPRAVLRLGSRLVSGDWDRHNWEGLDGVIDNIKIWNFPKVDFADRFIE